MSQPIKPVPGTVRTDIADDAKGDPSRIYPPQPAIYVPEEKSDAETHSAGEHEPPPPDDSDRDHP
jgi:hypothetical protein